MLKTILIGSVAVVCVGLALLYFFIYRHVGYKIKNSEVYFVSWNEGNGFQQKKIDADSQSFKKISGDYAKDKNHVFFVGRIIESADADSFERIKVDSSTVEDVYSKDKTHVFKFSGVLPNVDHSSFVALGGSYTKDAQHVFYQEKILTSAEASTFQTKHHEFHWFGMDSKQVYSMGQAIPGADPATFELLGGGRSANGAVAKDKNHNYSSIGEVL